MAQKGTGARISNFETNRRKSSHLLRTDQGVHTAAPRDGDSVWAGQHWCPPSGPAEAHDYTVPLTSPFGFVSFPSPSCPRPLDPACKYVFTITSRCTDS